MASWLWTQLVAAIATVTGNNDLPEEIRRKELKEAFSFDPDICPYDEIRDLQTLRDMHDDHWFV